MPYSASALGVLPPLWSRAAKKPRPVPTFSNCAVSTLPYSGTCQTRLTPGDDCRAVLPRAGWRAVASDDFGLVGAPGFGGAVGVDHDGPAHPVDYHVVVVKAVQLAVGDAGLA